MARVLEAAQALHLLAPMANLRLAPVRHHSPRCARHLRALIEAFAPDTLLIEGPQELDALLPALQHAKAQPPLAVYLHAAVGRGEDELRCRGYIPFAEFSPEWVALRAAGGLGAAVRFIDLPYGARLGLSAQLEFFATAPEPTLDAEPPRQAPDVLAGLIEDAGCRDFDEWWDRHFESGVEPATAADYFADLLAFSLLLRARGEGDDAENAAREAHMAAQVCAALDEGRRCLVVCGGYHVPGLLAGLGERMSASVGETLAALGFASAPSAVPRGAGQDSCEVGAHLIAYSLERLARASGYAAGLPAPGYYQAVWQAWERGAAQPYRATWPALAARLANLLREQGLPVTLPDAREAVAMAGRLAALRGWRGGRAELAEALQATLVKDADDVGLFAGALAELFGGSASGRLPPNAPLAPLLVDVQSFCTRYRLPARLGGAQRKELDIYRSARHREISRGLQRLRFLGIPYAQRLAGPDFVAGADLARVREIWELAWRLETTTALTEAARYGASLEEAAVNRLLELLAPPSAGNPAALVLEVLVMGLEALAERVLDAVALWLERSFDALALAQAAGRLALAYEARNALGGVGLARLQPLLARAFAQACLRLPALGQGDAAHAAAAVDALADLHGMVRRAAAWADGPLLLDACGALHEADVPAPVRGAAAGVLAMAGRWSATDTDLALAAALGLAHTAPQTMGEYLQGFLRIARGWLLGHPPTVLTLSARIAAWSEEEFLDGLPALRLAFSQLTRRELQAFAQLLVGREQAPALLAARVPDEATLRRSQALAAQVATVLQHWGFDD
ncbi:hypothetical protein SAMN05216201_10641 [Pseudomonas linyingensis]|uniref:4-aminobutyrate aminotransferase n=1 Tax=Pseudomonas linyingensis TaxID=915471 RepID=A0A1H6XGI8_9PSED|nr:DUF5682 family protein [Pseudomonas linyingensis]SEJ23980.1 hypothetical protein SAMN05216201_10641 [Pseudomonas linyingensis]